MGRRRRRRLADQVRRPRDASRHAAPPRPSRGWPAWTTLPDPGEPVIHGRLMVGRRMRRLGGRGDAEGAPLWWPQGKVAGEYLPRWLTEHEVTPPAAEEPAGEGITIHRPLSARCRAEIEYLRELCARVRVAAPAIASLGRHMREARGRLSQTHPSVATSTALIEDRWRRRSKPPAASSRRPAGEPRSGRWRIWPV